MSDETTYRVELRLEAAADRDRRRLEELCVDAMEALDGYGSAAVLGVAGSVTADPPALDIEIGVRAGSPAELHRTLADVFETLEEHAGTSGLLGASFVERARPDSAVAGL